MSLIIFQIMRVISSPSISTSGVFMVIFSAIETSFFLPGGRTRV